MIRGTFLTSKDDTSQVIAIRHAVFVDEQGYSADLERDSYDDMSIYALAFTQEGLPAATGRLYLDEDGHFTIGRVATLPAARGRGLGDLVMRMLLYRAQELNAPYILLGAQKDKTGFYSQYGFAPCAEEYLDQGVPHIPMRVMADAIDLQGKCPGHRAK